VRYYSFVYWANLCKLLRAVGLLSRPAGATVGELQQGLGISRRSVYRLFDTMDEMGFPRYEEEAPGGPEKRWKLQERYVSKLPNMDVPRVDLTPEEAMLLSFLLSHGAIFRHTDLESPLGSLRRKLSAIVPLHRIGPGTAAKIDSLFVSVQRFTKDYSGSEELIETLVGAVLEQRTCRVSYHAFSTGRTSSFDIDPLRLVEHDGGLYAFVRVTRYDSIRIIAVERIRGLEVSDLVFDYPADFDAEGMLRSSFGLTFGDPVAVRVWFSPEQAPYVAERRWADTQEIETQSDGSVILSMTTSGVFDVKRWVLSFGAQARLIEPIDLAREIRADLEQAAEQYEKKLAQS